MLKFFKKNTTVPLSLRNFETLLELLDQGTKFTVEVTPFGLLCNVPDDVLEDVQHRILEQGKINQDDQALLEAFERRN
jgi:hypothetical protein